MGEERFFAVDADVYERQVIEKLMEKMCVISLTDLQVLAGHLIFLNVTVCRTIILCDLPVTFGLVSVEEFCNTEICIVSTGYQGVNFVVFILQPKPFDYEHSEMILYQNTVIREAGNLSEALKHLEEHDKEIVDRLSVQEIRGMQITYSTGGQNELEMRGTCITGGQNALKIRGITDRKKDCLQEIRGITYGKTDCLQEIRGMWTE